MQLESQQRSLMGVPDLSDAVQSQGEGSCRRQWGFREGEGFRTGMRVWIGEGMKGNGDGVKVML